MSTANDHLYDGHPPIPHDLDLGAFGITVPIDGDDPTQPPASQGRLS